MEINIKRIQMGALTKTLGKRFRERRTKSKAQRGISSGVNYFITMPQKWHAHDLSYQEWMNKIKQQVKQY